MSLAALLPMSSAIADNFTGKTNAVCAATNVVACTNDGNCLQGQAHTFDLPAFMFIDIEQKTVRTTKDSATKAFSKILTQEITDQSVILQGIENDRGWTLVLNRPDGRMHVSSTGTEVNFMISGNCTAL